MSFKQRAINVTFTTAPGNPALPSGDSQINLSGHRAEVVVDMPGVLGMESLNLRIWGMKLSDMNALSTQTHQALAIVGNTVAVSAGDVDGQINQVFFGGIMTAFIDFSGAPDVSFNVLASPWTPGTAKPAAPIETNGQIDVAGKIGELAQQLGFTFVNNGVTVQLSNQYLPGTAVDQIRTLVRAAGIAAGFGNNTLTIWPNGAYANDEPVMISAATGMIGYAQFTPTGVIVKTLFNPDAQAGRKASIKSIVSMANADDWTIQGLRHELSTQMAGGPWTTTINVGGLRYAKYN